MSGSDVDSESGSVLMLEASKTGDWHTFDCFTMFGPNGDEKLKFDALAMDSFSLLLNESFSLVSDRGELAISLSLSPMMLMHKRSSQIYWIAALSFSGAKKAHSQAPRFMMIG